MNFDLTEDEEMLKAMAERFVADRCDLDRRRAALAEPHGFSPENWALLGELGLIAALIGPDLGASASAVLFEALGRGLATDPLIENVVLAGGLFAACAPAGVLAAWHDGLADGSRRLALAHAERDGQSQTLADSAGRITGAKPYVIAGAGADGYIVSARDAAGLALYLVEAAADGLTARPWRLADGSMAVALTLNNVPAQRLDGDAVAALAAAETRAGLARAAEAIGIMERMQADTLEYLRTRQQFGVALASFQAIQHRMVAQYAVVEQARALLNLAIVTAETPDHARAVRGVRAYLAQNALPFAHDMVQFHGGMGITDELAISHGHKRLMILSRWPEDPDSALDAYAAA